MKREIAEKAAKWWGDILCHHHDNGANDEANGMAMMLADLLAMSNKPTDEQISKFVEVLTNKLECMDDHTVTMYCDYHPDMILLDVANEIGIDESVFPYKTGMTIFGDKVTVRAGYGAQSVEI